MRNVRLISILIPVVALSACQSPAANQEAAKAPDTTVIAEPDVPMHQFAAWQGKWNGVEGMFVTITPTEPGKYLLGMRSDLDTIGRYVGRDVEGGIEFQRGTDTLLLKAASGDETGLKYLAGKNECLMVKSGEGYCRG